MSKVYLICGRICSGKTTYAKKFCEDKNAILLSVDEIMISLFDQCCGPKLHMEYDRRIKAFLFNKSLEILETGVDVVLDWGLWTREERDFAKNFYKTRSIDCELHYIEVSDEVWEQQLNKRNNDVLENKTKAYYMELSRALEFASKFQKPEADEVDVFI